MCWQVQLGVLLLPAVRKNDIFLFVRELCWDRCVGTYKSVLA